MRGFKRTTGGSVFVGSLPEGCKLCLRGEKLVLFATGICCDKCYYCPLSFARRDKDHSFGNERKLASEKDLLLEAARMKAKGAGVTGGDPMLRVERTVKFVKALKRKFGKKFHVHLYTSGTAATPAKLRKLYAAGVDEIRFHRNLAAVKMASRFKWKVGCEVPAMPKKFKVLKEFLIGAEQAGATFCNMNELEFSEGNAVALLKRKLITKHRLSPAVRGSEEVAIKLLVWGAKHLKSMSLHYCPSYVKDGVQLRNRFLRTAKNVRKPYQIVDVDGLLVFGVVAGSQTDRKEILRKLRVPPKLIEVAGRGKLYTSVKIADRLSRKGYRCWIEKRYPTADDTLIELEPI